MLHAILAGLLTFVIANLFLAAGTAALIGLIVGIGVYMSNNGGNRV